MNFKFTKKHIIAVILVTIGVALMFLGGCNNSGNESGKTTETIVTSTATDGTTGDSTEAETTESSTTETTEEATTQSATDATEEVTTESATDATEIGRDEDIPLTTTEAIIEEVIEITTQAQTTEVPATTEATNASERVWVEPVYEQVWVVDREAQTVELPIYEERGKEVCNGCGADITSNPSAHITVESFKNGCTGYHSEVEYVVVGYDTIYEPEEGHWETVCVQEGYWKEVE